MEKNTASDAPVPLLGEDWFDPLEAGFASGIVTSTPDAKIIRDILCRCRPR